MSFSLPFSCSRSEASASRPRRIGVSKRFLNSFASPETFDHTFKLITRTNFIDLFLNFLYSSYAYKLK